MTWDWETVREEACGYYAEGYSLTEVKKLIKRKRPDFDPSDRAYRLKFREWNVKRPRTTAADDSGALDRPPQANSVVSQHRGPRQASSYDLNSPTTCTHDREKLSHACWCCAVELERRLLELFACFDDQFRMQDLSHWIYRRVDGSSQENIVHLLARDRKWARIDRYSSVLTGLCVRMKDDGLSLDGEDCDGVTPLELSIRTDNLDALRVLLEYRASLGRGVHDDEALLGLVCEKSLSNFGVIVELLRHIKKTESVWQIPFDCLNEQAVQHIDAILSSSADEQELEDVYFVIAHLTSVVQWYQYDSDAQTRVLRSMLENWGHRDLASSTIDGEEWALDRLHDLLKIELEDDDCEFESSWNRRAGAHSFCDYAAHYVVSHICDEALVNQLLATTSLRGHLGQAVLHACDARHWRCAAAYLFNMLRQASLGLNDSDLQGHLDTLMVYTPADLMTTFWGTLVGQRSVDIRTKEQRYERSLTDILLNMGEPRIWAAAELVLPHDLGFPPSPRDAEHAVLFNEHRFHGTLYFYYASKAYLDHLCRWRTGHCRTESEHSQEPTEDHECGCHTFIEHDRAPWKVNWRWRWQAKDAVKMQRCVIHVITKDLCKRTSLFAPGEPLSERIQSALKLSQQFKLPDLAIEPAILLRVLSGTEGDEDGSDTESEASGENGGEPATALSEWREGIYQPEITE